MLKIVICAAALVIASPASAEVVSASANGLVIRHAVSLVVPPEVAFSAFGKLPQWWNAKHSYSGDSANMSLALTPGGCLCERLPDGGGIEHLRVTYVEPGKSIVLTGALGPLLYEAASGVMSVKFERIAGGTRVSLDYRLAGFASGGADAIAPAVDEVLADQMRRYRAFAAKQKS